MTTKTTINEEKLRNDLVDCAVESIVKLLDLINEKIDKLTDILTEYVLEDLGFENSQRSETILLRDSLKKTLEVYIRHHFLEDEIRISYKDGLFSVLSEYVDDLNVIYIIYIRENTIIRKKMF